MVKSKISKTKNLRNIRKIRKIQKGAGLKEDFVNECCDNFKQKSKAEQEYCGQYIGLKNLKKINKKVPQKCVRDSFEERNTTFRKPKMSKQDFIKDKENQDKIKKENATNKPKPLTKNKKKKLKKKKKQRTKKAKNVQKSSTENQSTETPLTETPLTENEFTESTQNISQISQINPENKISNNNITGQMAQANNSKTNNLTATAISNNNSKTNNSKTNNSKTNNLTATAISNNNSKTNNSNNNSKTNNPTATAISNNNSKTNNSKTNNPTAITTENNQSATVENNKPVTDDDLNRIATDYKKVQDDLQASLNKQTATIESLTTKISSLGAKVESKNAEVDKKNLEIERLKEELNSMTETKEQKEKELADCTSAKIKCEAELDSLEAIAGDDGKGIKGAQGIGQAIKNLRKQITDASVLEGELKSTISSQESKIEELKNLLTGRTSEVEKIISKVNSIQDVAKNAEEQLTKTISNIASNNQNVNAFGVGKAFGKFKSLGKNSENNSNANNSNANNSNIANNNKNVVNNNKNVVNKAAEFDKLFPRKDSTGKVSTNNEIGIAPKKEFSNLAVTSNNQLARAKKIDLKKSVNTAVQEGGRRQQLYAMFGGGKKYSLKWRYVSHKVLFGGYARKSLDKMAKKWGVKNPTAFRKRNDLEKAMHLTMYGRYGDVATRRSLNTTAKVLGINARKYKNKDSLYTAIYNKTNKMNYNLRGGRRTKK